MTYVLLSLGFLAVACAVAAAAVARRRRQPAPAPFGWPAIALAALALMILTAIFDNVIIGLGLVSYGEAQISGVRIGLAPIEDFSYSLAALLLLPALWVLFTRAPRGPAPQEGERGTGTEH